MLRCVSAPEDPDVAGKRRTLISVNSSAPGRWRHHIPSKSRGLLTPQHSVTPQKTKIPYLMRTATSFSQTAVNIVRPSTYLAALPGLPMRFPGQNFVWTKVGQKISLQCLYFGFLLFRLNWTATPLLLHTFLATTEAHIWNEYFCLLLIQVSVLWYQPSCHNFLQLATIFQFVGGKI
jgi:hypothetical protein